ncbi:ubl carboxyl-terminal hydrolase 18 [Lampris incognitus]|uniref:ubl carboxyl-terminal hydrolase 18 n=1 Tax=Lampris incognitus TaxID=2546036 RepID=UPI0024B5077C|nr:ubl carboxyl-terminal hydrolase 18 [Lampris incognitus]
MAGRESRFYALLYRSNVSGIRGLYNYGLSCCVNALLQSFSATWELVRVLDRWEPPAREGDFLNVPLQLKRAVKAMQSDHSQPAPHQHLLRCLDKNHISLYKQHDADEVFLSMLNYMEKHMDDKALALEIHNLYRISVETYLECLDCAHILSGSSYLLSLPLHIRAEQNSLEDRIKSFFELQELNGRNKCRCAQCGSKTQCRQGLKLLSLPPVLPVHLKRFHNYHGYIRKLDCKVTFPETFDFRDILKEEAFSKNYVQKESKYMLYAVIVHLGTVMSGHYTAYVRHHGGWYYANDSRVNQATWEDVQDTYGGLVSGTAYMLLYRRTKDEAEEPKCSG